MTVKTGLVIGCKMGKSKTLIGAKLIIPLRQGDRDSLCGMYAVINAIRLIHAKNKPLIRQKEKLLFHAGVRFLNRRHNLENVFIEGMSGRTQIGLAKYIIDQVNEQLESKMVFHRLRVKKATYTELIEGEIDAGRPVCVLFDGALDHYSVIVGYSRSRFILFDSTGLAWVRRDACRLSGSKGKVRHMIEKSCLYSVGGA